MAEQFKIGDVVVHKAKTGYNNIVSLTIHSFTNSMFDSNAKEEYSDWVFCQWFNTQTFGYQKTAFNVNELEKV
jgi:uncharacterized protein YodC (DUF2158 family)